MNSMHRHVNTYTSSDIAIVVPVFRDYLTHDDRISLAHLERWLTPYDWHTVQPQSLDLDLPNFETRVFDDAYFADINGYSHLLLTRDFYQAFADYTYILIYQLDALVFKNSLLEWCNLGYDYIGAPWLKSSSNPSLGFSGVGNGGLSLRRVQSFLRVFDSQRHKTDLAGFMRDSLKVADAYPDQAMLARKLLSRMRDTVTVIGKGVLSYLEEYRWNEDLFWASKAELFYPEFRVPEAEIALRFAFEQAPTYCFEQNAGQLPFGCHGWPKYEREFWETYLLQVEE